MISLLPAVGFLYGIDPFYDRPLTAIAWPTVIALFSAGIGLVLAVRERGPMDVLMRDDPGGALLRRLFPAAVLIPLVLGYLAVQGQSRGLFATPVGTAILALALVLAFSALLWRSAKGLSAASAAQRASEHRYRDLVQNTDSAIVRWKRGGAVTFFNEYAQRFFGYSEDEILGKDVRLLVAEPKSDSDSLRTLVEDILAEPEKHIPSTNENVLRDGTRVWMTWTNRAVLDQNGEVAEILSVGSDVTRQQKAEEALRESEARYRSLVDVSPIAIIVKRGDRIEFANPAALELFGADSHEQLLSKSVYEVFHPDYHDTIRQRQERLSRGRVAPLIEKKIVRIDGSERDVEAAATPFFDDRGAAVQVVLHDITDRKRAEEFEKNLEAERLEFCRRTLSAATRGKLVVTKRDDILRIAGDSALQMTFSLPDEVGLVRAKAAEAGRAAGLSDDQVHRLISCAGEMLSNAVKHAGGGTASIHRRDSRFILVVSDSGYGIDALDLPDVAFTRGFSTAGTGGLGYKLIIASADKVYLATGPDGTTVAVEIELTQE